MRRGRAPYGNGVRGGRRGGHLPRSGRHGMPPIPGAAGRGRATGCGARSPRRVVNIRGRRPAGPRVCRVDTTTCQCTTCPRPTRSSARRWSRKCVFASDESRRRLDVPGPVSPVPPTGAVGIGGGISGHQPLLRGARQPLDRELGTGRRRAIGHLRRVDEPHRTPGARVRRAAPTRAGLAPVLAQPSRHVGRHARVERAVGAAQHVHVPGRRGGRTR